MKKNTINKITIWISSFILVFTFTFFNLSYKDSRFIVRTSDVVLEANAVTKTEIISALMLGVYYVMSGQAIYYLGEVTSTTIDQIRTWYDNKIANNDAGLVAFTDSASEYILGTNQDITSSIVLPKVLINELSFITDQYYKETTNLEYNNYIYNYGQNQYKTKVPYYVTSETTKIPMFWTGNTYVHLNGGSDYFLTNPDITYKYGYVDDGFYTRFKVEVYYKGSLIGTRYSNRADNGSNNAYLYKNSKNFYPLIKQNGDSINVFIKFVKDDQTLFNSTNDIIGMYCPGPTNINCIYGQFFLNNFPGATSYNSLKMPGLGIEQAYMSDYPTSWADDNFNVEANYYKIPVIPGDSNISNTINNYYTQNGTVPAPTYIPPDQEAQYIYNPVPVVDIGSGMPITPDLEVTNDPTLSVPLPGLDDLLDGTYFKDIAVWFTAWLTLTISNITQFWNTAWANLTLGINWLGISIKSLLDNMLEQLLIPLNQATINFDLFRDKLGPGIDPIIDLLTFVTDVIEFGIKFIVHTISFLFDLVALLIGSIFNLLRSTITSFITLIQSLYSFFPEPIRSVANFVFTTLGFALVYKFIRAVLGLKGV